MKNRTRFVFSPLPIAMVLPGMLAGTCSLALPVAAAPAKTVKANSQPAAKPVANPAKPGHVTGRITNASGAPLAAVQVNIYGTTMAGANFSTSVETNAAGVYSQRVPDGIYGVSAYHKTRYNNKNYRFTLHPQDGVANKKHESAKGVVKNFVWRIAGLKPGQRAGEAGSHTEGLKYYGGYVYVKSKESSTLGGPIYFPKGSTLEVTMTPRTKLIDGSTGKPLVFRKAFDRDIDSSISWYLTDIPVGLYDLSAALVSAGGERRNLNARRSLGFSDPYPPQVAVDFEPTSFEDMQMMQITIEP